MGAENKQIKSALDKSTQAVNTMRLSLDTANSGNNKLTSDIDRITRENSKLNSNVVYNFSILPPLIHGVRYNALLSNLEKLANR